MKQVLDVCCGGKMFWFDKSDERVCFMDNRVVEEMLFDGRYFSISPDIMGDFRNMPFPDETFSLVVFDPPHLVRAGDKSWINVKYGRLGENWRDDLKKFWL